MLAIVGTNAILDRDLLGFERLPIRSKTFVQFLWLPSLGDPDPMYILPILSALSTWVMSRQTSNGATGAAAQQQKIMTIFMPLFIGYISLSFPSGLVIYWVVSNVFQLIQQHFIYKNLNAK